MFELNRVNQGDLQRDSLLPVLYCSCLQMMLRLDGCFLTSITFFLASEDTDTYE